MRIAEISAFSQYSVGKIMKNIKSYIDENTDDVCEVFYARGDDSFDPGVHRFAKNYEVYLNAIRARIFDDDGFGFKGNTRRLIKQLNDFNPDIVHLHCLHGYYLNLSLLFKYLKQTKLKVMWTMHDAWAFTGHCCYFSMIDCNKWKSQCLKCPQKKEYPATKVFDCSKKNYEKKKKLFTSFPVEQLKIVAPSYWLSDLLNISYLSKYSIETIHNGIDTSFFNTLPSCESINLPPNKKILLGIASVWDKRKGLDIFLKLSKNLSQDWHIVLIGKTQKKLVFPENITHLCRTTNLEVLKAYYQKADVFLNPTLDENYPTVNLEAQACGCKVICFDSGGAKETNCGLVKILDKNIQLQQLAHEIDDYQKLNKQDLCADTERIDQKSMSSNYYLEMKKLFYKQP